MRDAELPPDVTRLFWDVDLEALELDRDAAYVMERVMSRGTWAAMCWLRRRYAPASLASFLQRHGQAKLAPRDLAYWCLVCDVTLPVETGGGRPRWAGP